MTEKPPFKVTFDFPGAMRQLGRVTRRAYNTVKDKADDWDSEKGETDEERKDTPGSPDRERE